MEAWDLLAPMPGHLTPGAPLPPPPIPAAIRRSLSSVRAPVPGHLTPGAPLPHCLLHSTLPHRLSHTRPSPAYPTCRRARYGHTAQARIGYLARACRARSGVGSGKVRWGVRGGQGRGSGWSSCGSSPAPRSHRPASFYGCAASVYGHAASVCARCAVSAGHRKAWSTVAVPGIAEAEPSARDGAMVRGQRAACGRSVPGMAWGGAQHTLWG
eukprot:495291-Rhodomonas_salina.1